MATGVELATAYVTLAVSTKGMGNDIRRQFGQVSTQAGVTGKDAGKKFGGGLLSTVKGFAGPLLAAAGIGVVVSQLASAVGAGSDFQQAIGGADAVFKKSAGRIKKNADGAALALGLSKTEYLELATALGAGLKNKGIKDFAGSTEDLIGIGADLSAQFGGSTQDAVNALGSALRGEMDPIERYGISMNEAALKAEAMRLGLHKGKGPLSDQAKAQAALSLVTKQSADAQGAFARESDTLAGKQARLSASWDDIKTQVGTALLPALTSVSGWFLEKGLPAIQRFGGWIKDKLWPALKEGYATIMPGLKKALDIISGGVGDGEFSWKELGETITDKVIPFIAKLTNVYLPMWATQIRVIIDVVKTAWKIFETWRDIVLRVASVIMGAFLAVTDVFIAMLRALGKVPGFGWARDAADKMQNAADKARGIKRAIDNIPNSKTVTVTVNEKYKSVGTSRFKNDGVGYAPGREKGGPVRKGQPYIVGEKRPELFVPDQNGTIIPRVPGSAGGAAFGATETVNHISLIVDGKKMTEVVVDHMGRILGGGLTTVGQS